MSVPLDRVLRDRWWAGNYVGDARPTCTVEVRRAYLKRGRDADGVWSADWTPIEDFRPLPGVQEVGIETSFDSNGIRTATIDLANVYMRELEGVLGEYHRREKGWFSPYRAFVAPMRRPRLEPALAPGQPNQRVQPNEWERILGESAEVLVRQGYGDQTIRTFSGLLDTAGGKGSTMRLVARDFGQLLTDVHPFGWNIDPHLRDPITFVDRGYVRRREQSSDPAKRREARDLRKRAVIVDDLTDIVRIACRWAGFPKASLRIQKAGTTIRQPVSFSRGEYLIDLVKKVQSVTGFVFFIGTPTADHPMGRPTLRPSQVVYPHDPVEELRDDMLLTGLDWQRTDEPLAAIIRVRGKDDPEGMTLGGDKLRRVMSVYRPPWHVPRPSGYSGDSRVIRHVVHTETLLSSKHQCEVMARQIALQEALASVSANIEIPARPGLEVDDVIGTVDGATGINSRALIARLQSTYRAGAQATFKQTLGVGLMDTPDVVHVVDDLHDELLKRDDDPMLVNPVGFGGVTAPVHHG